MLTRTRDHDYVRSEPPDLTQSEHGLRTRHPVEKPTDSLTPPVQDPRCWVLVVVTDILVPNRDLDRAGNSCVNDHKSLQSQHLPKSSRGIVDDVLIRVKDIEKMLSREKPRHSEFEEIEAAVRDLDEDDAVRVEDPSDLSQHRARITDVLEDVRHGHHVESPIRKPRIIQKTRVDIQSEPLAGDVGYTR